MYIFNYYFNALQKPYDNVSAHMRYIDWNICKAISMIKITLFRTSPASYSNFGISYCNQINGLSNEWLLDLINRWRRGIRLFLSVKPSCPWVNQISKRPSSLVMSFTLFVDELQVTKRRIRYILAIFST